MSLTLLFRDFALLGAEWVMWLLIGLSLLSITIMIERAIFFRKRRIEIDDVRTKVDELLDKNQYDKAIEMLKTSDSMEGNVVSYAMRYHKRGPEAVEDLIRGAVATEKLRYDRGMSVLGTIGNNAPFIGLFGTVLGIIGAFANLGEGSSEAAQQVMGSISEALVATGVGLLVAIPAVIAFNIFKSKTKRVVANTELLSCSLLSHLKSEEE